MLPEKFRFKFLSRHSCLNDLCYYKLGDSSIIIRNQTYQNIDSRNLVCGIM